MTVAEMIVELQKYDPETPVGVYADGVLEDNPRVYAWDYPKFGGRKEYVVIE